MLEDPARGERLATRLLERDEELWVLATLIADCRDGRGRVALTEGPAGIGKSSLLGEARALAHSEGVTVLTARGGELERQFGFGVVRQLLEPQLVGADADRRAQLIAGAAELALPVFTPQPSTRSSEPAHSVLHGLYWLVANLAERSPVLLVVDDVHLADAASLRFLLYLARRVEGLPLALCFASRTGEAATEAELLRALVLEASPPVIRPRALSAAAVEWLVRAAIGAEASSEFCGALFDASGGNPFLVVEALEELRSRANPVNEIDPAALGWLASERIAASLLMRVGSIDPYAPALVRGVAVLGEHASRDRASILAELDGDLASSLVDALAGAAILTPGEPLTFVHPLVRTAIYEDMSTVARADLHRRAAHLLAEDGAAPESIAIQLLAVEPRADAFALEALRAAAASATARGSPETAVRYLRRALQEAHVAPDLHELLFELGLAEVMAVDGEAIETLRQAVARSPAGRRRAEVARVLARVLVAFGHQGEGIEVYDAAIANLNGAEPDLAIELDAEAANAARMIRFPRPLTAEDPTRHGRRIEPTSRAERMALAELAHDCALDNGPASKVAMMARHALEGGQLAAETADAGPVWDALFALLFADELDLAEHHLQGLLAQARKQGSLIPVAGASALLAFSALKRGDMVKTASEAQAVLDAAQGGLGLITAMGNAYLAHALIERGELEAATRVLEDALPTPAVPDDVVFDHLLFERARLRIALGQPSAALADLRLLGDHVAHWHRGSLRTTDSRVPTLPYLPGLQHRTLLARVLTQLDDHAGAVQAAEEELALARAWGTPRALGVALHACGFVAGGERGIDLIREAVTHLARSPGRLEHAYALVDLGSALRRTRRKAEARQELAEGMDIAHRCGGLALAETAHKELGLAGARPRRLALTGVESLTPGEYRVCEMAADGMTNKEIAQALFVTLRTVEMHLSRAYGKLDIGSRRELERALHARPDGAAFAQNV